MTRLKGLSKANIERLEKGLEIIHLEDTECEWLTTWLERDVGFDCFSHVSNETWTPSQNQKRKNTAMGVRSGVPDYIIILPAWFVWKKTNKLIFIEMKRTQGGTVSLLQKKWIKALNLCEGVDAHVAKGYKEAKEIILSYWSDAVKKKIQK